MAEIPVNRRWRHPQGPAASRRPDQAGPGTVSVRPQSEELTDPALVGCGCLSLLVCLILVGALVSWVLSLSRGSMGVATPASCRELRPGVPDRPYPLLRVGSRGPYVRELQRRLRGSGFDPGAVDGVFGPRTEEAVRKIQRAHRLKEDGVVGRQTWCVVGVR